MLPISCDSAPGTSVAKLNSARPLFAMFFNASLWSVNERSPLDRLQRGDGARHGDFFAQRADVQGQRAGRKLVVRVDDQVRPLRVLKPVSVTWSV